jgi:cytidylate kinase
MTKDKTNKFVMTIDGPGGSGKDKLAENLLETGIFDAYSVRIFNTGNFSRTIAYVAFCQNISPADSDFKEFAIATMHDMNFLHVEPENLKKTEVEDILKSVASIPEIRDGFKTRLPNIIQSFPEDVIVVLGRITGPVYPQANLKIFLETNPDICAHRRALEKSNKGEDYDTIYQKLKERNKIDTKWNNDLTVPADTYTLNTDDLTEQQVCQKVSDQLGMKFLEWKGP